MELLKERLEDVERYCVDHSSKPSEVCEAIFNYTKENCELSEMLIGPVVGSFLKSIVGVIQGKSVLEIGTFTGYSALCFAEGLPSSGKVITLDINPQTVEIGKRFWKQSPHGKKIESILGPAEKTMKDLIRKGKKFDVILIDADKARYPIYFKFALKLLTKKGLILLDNCLRGGEVLSQGDVDEGTHAIKSLSEEIKKNKKLWKNLLPIRDGLLMVAPVRK